MPKISVIMSVYNNESYLKDSIESILKQTYKNFEFIITDDCSTDKSASIISDYDESDERINFIKNKKNIGLTKSLNKMIDLARGEYIARMDGDDIAKKNRFKEQIEVMENNKNIDVLFSNVSLIDENNNNICSSFRPNSLYKILNLMEFINYIPHPTVMVKKTIFKKYGKYNSEYIKGQDKELWQRLIKHEVNFFYLNKILLLYRIHSNNISKQKKKFSKGYKLANICISNNSKLKGFKYFRSMNIKEKLIFLFKVLIPYKLLFLKGLLFRKLGNR
jgi:glycosyltransferase involved in cell wall biosynthesis